MNINYVWISIMNNYWICCRYEQWYTVCKLLSIRQTKVKSKKVNGKLFILEKMFIKVCHNEEHNFLRVYWNLATIQNWSRRQKIVGLRNYADIVCTWEMKKTWMKGKSEKQHDHDHYYMYIGGNLQSTAVTEKVLTYYFSYTCFLDTCNLSIHYNLDSTNFKATINSADSSSLLCTVLRAQYSFLYTYTRITTYTTHCGSDFSTTI